MLEFQFSWLLWLAPLPLLMYFLRPEKQEDVALRVPFFQQAMALQQQESRRTPTRPLRYIALWTIWLSALFAAANPQWLGEPVSIQGSGRDLLLAVDISGSMQIEDMQLHGKAVNRLIALKQVVGNFVESRKSDRLGLILFGSQAYLQAPLTYDRHTVGVLLQEAQIGFAGEQTAIGDAIGLAVKRLRSRPDNSRVLILLTDGANTSGELTPRRAAELAKHEHIKIYTIGFGADEMVVPGIFGNRRINPSEDLDEEAMRAVADATGGQYFRARTPEELDAIHKELNRLEPIELDSRTFRPVRTLFFWPLSLAFIISLLFALTHWWQRRDSRNAMEASQ